MYYVSTCWILYRNRRFLKYRFETLGTAVGGLKMYGSDKECRIEVTLNWPKRSSRCSSWFLIETKFEVPMYIHDRYMSSCIRAICNFTCDFRTAVASRWFPFDCYHIRFVCRIRHHQIRLSRRRWWTCNKKYKRVQTETTRTSNIIESRLLRLREIRIELKRDVVGVR